MIKVDCTIPIRTSESNERIVVLMRGTSGAGPVERADAKVHGFERPFAIDEDGSDPVTLVFALR